VTKKDIEALQRSLNRFTRKYLRGVAPLQVDGKLGPATNRRIRTAKFYLGYGRPERNSSRVRSAFVRRLRHPHSRKYSPARMLATAAARRVRQRNRWRSEQLRSVTVPGVTRYDGVPVAKVAVPILNWCRRHGWKGRLVSGYRSPAYSESLCRRMCGAPRCPGLCAGRTSNHSGNSPARFAVDVSDYDNFRRVVARCPVKPRIWNNLPRDPAHFSPSGN
jgi:hypothetical protein